MKNSFCALSAIAVICGFFTFTSCDRDRYNNVPDTVAGTWTLARYGKDVNANHALESGETTTAATAGIDAVVAYKANGTYTFSSASAGNVSGKWFERNGTIYTIKGSDTSVALLVSVTANQLVTLNNDSLPASWYVYSK